MNRLFSLTVIFSSLLTIAFCSCAFADVAPTCGGRGYDNRFCPDNPYHLTKNECIDFCENSEYCKVYQDGSKTVFGGYWRLSDQSEGYYFESMESCKVACEYEKEKCNSNDQACLSQFYPENTDCSQLTDENDRNWCHNNCIDSILTSQCGKSCLRNGMKNAVYFISPDGTVNYRDIGGCVNEYGPTLYCSEICDENYCASIPLEYDTKWSAFGALLTFLTVLCGVILFVINRILWF